MSTAQDGRHGRTVLFVCLFVCVNPFCKEVVAVGGDYETESFLRPDEDGDLIGNDWGKVASLHNQVVKSATILVGRCRPPSVFLELRSRRGPLSDEPHRSR